MCMCVCVSVSVSVEVSTMMQGSVVIQYCKYVHVCVSMDQILMKCTSLMYNYPIL